MRALADATLTAAFAAAKAPPEEAAEEQPEGGDLPLSEEEAAVQLCGIAGCRLPRWHAGLCDVARTATRCRQERTRSRAWR